jgi:hypothetical protein
MRLEGFKEFSETSGISRPFVSASAVRVTAPEAGVVRRKPAAATTEFKRQRRRGSGTQVEASEIDHAASQMRKVHEFAATAEVPREQSGALAELSSAQKAAQEVPGWLKSAMKSGQPLERHRLDGVNEHVQELSWLLGRVRERRGAEVPSLRGPSVTFPVTDSSGDRIVARVTPRLHPATLDVSAPSHGQVQVGGLARFFPAHTVHARRSTAVVAGNHCELQSVDHYHIHRLSVSFRPLLEPGSGHAALQRLLKDHNIPEFQRAMRHLADTPHDRETQASVPVRPDPHLLATSSASVQMGDRSRTRMNTHYLVDETRLPIVNLLAHDRGLVESLIAAVEEPGCGSATEKLLRNAARSAGRSDELALLDHAAGLRAGNTSIYGLFGVDVVSRGSAVMVGAGNRLRTDMLVELGRLNRGSVLTELEQIRKETSVARDLRAAGQWRPVRAASPPRGVITPQRIPRHPERDLGRSVRPGIDRARRPRVDPGRGFGPGLG